jgi:hypothetical protein
MTKYNAQLVKADKDIRAKGTEWTFRRKVYSTNTTTGASNILAVTEQIQYAVMLSLTGSREEELHRVKATHRLLISGLYDWPIEPGDVAVRGEYEYTVEAVVPLAPDGTDLIVDLYVYR